jgi:hypothetical protein
MELFSKLPEELIQKIIDYTDIVTFRNGKYMNRISKKDERFEMLEKIQRPIKMYICPQDYKLILKLIDYKRDDTCGYIMKYIIKKEYIHLTIEFVTINYDGFDRQLIRKNTREYIYTVNNNWLKTIKYSM